MEPPAVEIKTARPANEPELIPLMAAFNQDEGIPWTPETMLPALRRLLHDPALGLVLVARDKKAGGVIGYGIGTFGYDLEFAGSDAFITELFVQPSFRGRGTGRALLDKLIRRLGERGAKAVHLMVRPENERARMLYERLGFQAVPRMMMSKVLR